MFRYFAVALLFAAAASAQEAARPEAQAREMIESALKDRNPDTRKLGATALGLGGPRRPFLELLTGLLDDKDVEVRIAAVTSLGDWKTRDAVAALRKALEDEVPEVSFAAAKALFAVHDPAGKTALLAVLSGETGTSSGFFSKHKREALRLLHTPKTALMMGAKQGLGFVPVPGLGEGIASLHALTSDPNFSGRGVAALLLGKEKDPAVTFALREALQDKDWSVRAAAVHSLALRNDPAVERDLTPLLEDKHPGVRLRVAAAILRLEQLRGRGGASRAVSAEKR